MEQRAVIGRGRGFRSLTPYERHVIATLGGLAAQRAGTAHKWTREEARAAGVKGGARRRERAEEQGS